MKEHDIKPSTSENDMMNKKLYYCRGTTQCATTIEILLTDVQVTNHTCIWHTC